MSKPKPACYRMTSWPAYRAIAVPSGSSPMARGSAYRSCRFAKALRLLAIRHIFTRPYTPKTNGKAERFIQTLMREWAYGLAHPSSNTRNADLPRWLDWFNTSRPHSALIGNGRLMFTL